MRTMRLSTVCGGILALALVLGAQPADAAKKGPRASLAAATVCALDAGVLTVTIRLTDKSSGGTVAPVVTAWTIEALAKTDTGNWDNQTTFGVIAGGPEPDLSDITVTFDLALAPANAKAVNAAATIYYDNDGDGGDVRKIENKCSDDPNTDVVEPSGIPL